MYKTNELDINYFVELAKSHVGEIGEVESQGNTIRQYGHFQIIDFKPENPHFTHTYWIHEEDDTPDGADLGEYTIKCLDTKFYKGKEIRVRVSAYVQEDKGVTKALYVDNINRETGKTLRAYSFGIIDFDEYETDMSKVLK